MSPWLANLIGLALGSVIGVEALYVALAERDNATAPPAPAAPAPVVSPPKSRAADHVPAIAGVRPVMMPRAAPLQVAHPDDPPKGTYPGPSSPQAHKPGGGIAGTGFFVAADGGLLTAAHVVASCARIRIASRWLQPTTAQAVAADSTQDIALLRATHTTPPAVLPVGRPAGNSGRLFVLGYPASGGPLVPTET
jgi:S1-C subfamily serine protease